MGFAEELRALAEQVRRRIANVKSEDATKQALILPFCQTERRRVVIVGRERRPTMADGVVRRGALTWAAEFVRALGVGSTLVVGKR